jgi:enoyl-CoA hydratase/carnithine racemase
MVERDLDGMRHLLTTCTKLTLTLRRLPQPVAAKVQGVATAAGRQLVAWCDLAVAAEEASFATLGARAAGSARAVGAKAVGAKRALELALTGDPSPGGSRPSHHLAPPTLESPERFVAADILLPPGTPVGR